MRSGSQWFIISNVLAAYFHTFITETYEGLFNSPYAIFGRCTLPNYGKGTPRRTRWSCDTRYGPSINDTIIFLKKKNDPMNVTIWKNKFENSKSIGISIKFHIKSPLQWKFWWFFVPLKVKIHNLSENEKQQQFLEKKLRRNNQLQPPWNSSVS